MYDPLDPNSLESSQGDSVENNLVQQSALTSSDEIVLPPSVNGRDRFITIEKISAETVSPLIKKDVSVDGVYEIVDRNFSYPFTAHVGLKFDSRSMSSIPERKYDVKMKKVKVPSNYFPTGGNGLDRRYVFSNPDYDGNPNTLDVVFMIDQNMNAATRALLRRNLQQFIFKLISGYTNVRFSIWQTAPTATETVINQATGEKIAGFTYYGSTNFFELETPDSAGANQTNLIKKLDAALQNANELTPKTNPAETSIANFFIRKSQFSITDEVGKTSEETVLENLWLNTVRKVIYFSGSTPELIGGLNTNPNYNPELYQIFVNRARENGVQFYYFNTDPDRSGTRTLRELSEDTGGAKFNLAHDSDIALQQFCDNNFYDSNKIYYGDWDGTFKMAWTDNPAWILYDIITDYNYGLGNYLNSSSVDKWTLYEIGRYCDAVEDNGKFRGVPDGKGGLEPRYTCNIIFYNKDEAYKVLQDIAAIFKGIVYWNTEGFSFFADKNKDPLMYFGNANVKDGAFVYTETAKNKRYTSVEITYNDKYDDYKTKVEFVEDVDGIRNYGINPFKVNAAGCSSRSEAKRIGRYILFSSMFEADTVSFVAGLEGAYLQPGDIFGVSDEVRNVGRTFGRILEVNENAKTIKIDGEFVSGLASGIYIHIPSGNFSVSDLNSMTGSDGGFTGTLEQIRARRQRQTRKFNLHTVVDDSYGATLTITGDYLLQSAVVDIYPIEGRVSGASYTGRTTLTGSVYTFPEYTVASGNPKWDSLTFSEVSGILSTCEVDVDLSGPAGTGQLVGNETNWTCSASGSNGIVHVNGSQVGSTAANLTAIALNSAGGLVAQSSTSASLADISTFVTGRSAGDVIVIISNGSPISYGTSVPTFFADYAATEIYKLGKDSSASGSYLAAFIKGNYRILERASKTSNDTGSLLFTYRDLLAFSRLRPYYTFVQADFGNEGESNYDIWQAGREYAVGNIVKVDGDTYICTKPHTKSAATFAADYDAGNSAKSKWSRGNSFGYYTVGLPQGFYGSDKVYLDTALTSTHVSNAFKSLGLEVYVGAGTLGQSDLRTLSADNGIGYSGLVYGTGYPKGFYNLSVDTTPKHLDLISEGSLYVLSGSGVEPKLYKTIGVKEEEANQYSVVGIEYLRDKENFIEKDIMDTAPSYYVQGPFDVVSKPNSPSGIASVSGYGNTGIHITWSGTNSPITGYKVYVSKPDYSTLSNEIDAITESYSVASGITTLTIPINDIWGQYDFDIYSQSSNQYRFLSQDPVQTGLVVLPTATLSINGNTALGVLVSGMTVDTADTKSLVWTGTHVSGYGQGNFTSADVTFRWKYIDPTGGVMSSKEQIWQNPYIDLPQKAIVQVLDNAGQILLEEKNYQGLSYTLTQQKNKELFATNPDSYRDVEGSRTVGLRVVITDNNNYTRTGTFYAYNVYPAYTKIQVIDSYQNSPYYALSGYYGYSGFTGMAVWGPEFTTTLGSVGTISGSGIRNAAGNLIRSEDDSIPLTFRDISGAFATATGYNGTGSAATPSKNGIIINYKGTGEPDYEAYVYAWPDLIEHYNKYVDKSNPIYSWGQTHYATYGANEGRDVPTLGNPLGIADLNQITPASNQTGFSGISFTVYPEDVSKGEIVFNCYGTSSNKDVYSVDIYTGDAIGFSADLVSHTNLFTTVSLDKTRAYLNTFKLGYGLETGVWHYFKLRPWDNFGAGQLSATVSGYLELEPNESTQPQINRFNLDGGKGQDIDAIEVAAGKALVKGYKYIIKAVGSVNWTSIGADTATINLEFIYNGNVISGSGGSVKRVETKYVIPEEELNSINSVTPRSDSSIVLPADIAAGNSAIFINRSTQHNLYILDSNGKEISIIRPNERAEVFREDTEWLDSRGSVLSLE